MKYFKELAMALFICSLFILVGFGFAYLEMQGIKIIEFFFVSVGILSIFVVLVNIKKRS